MQFFRGSSTQDDDPANDEDGAIGANFTNAKHASNAANATIPADAEDAANAAITENAINGWRAHDSLPGFCPS